jgi:hypothetical protein
MIHSIAFFRQICYIAYFVRSLDQPNRPNIGVGPSYPVELRGVHTEVS